MPALEEWFKIVAMRLDAICLVAPVTMSMTKPVGYRFAITSTALGPSSYLATNLSATPRVPTADGMKAG